MQSIRLDQHALKMQFPQQLLEHGTLVILACVVAGLSDRHTQGCLVKGHLGDELGSTATGGRNQTAQCFAITDQLIKIDCPACDLGDGPIPVGGAVSSGIHLQEEERKAESDGGRLRTMPSDSVSTA